MSHNVQLPLDIATIQTLLPHRYPFLLVDRVVEFEPHKRVLAYKNVTCNEPFFQGHFPGHPVMPGVLVVEALAQAGGVLTQLSNESTADGRLFYLVKIDTGKTVRVTLPNIERLSDDERILWDETVWLTWHASSPVVVTQ